ncbi:MAG: hypothetical protein NTU95_01965 [Methanothrix sp.]|nr:hypothetical protein [Methanothrix sp.]
MIGEELKVIQIIVALLSGIVGSFFYFRIGLEKRLVKLETLLPGQAIGLKDLETRVKDLELNMVKLQPFIEYIRQEGIRQVDAAMRKERP